MIDITDWMIQTAKLCEAFSERVYRIYPQKNLADKTYCVITPTAHAPRLMEDGQEVIADLSWTVQIFAKSPTAVDDALSELTDLYGGRNITLNGISNGYNPDYRQYTAIVSYSATVDRRGCVFR